MAGEYVRSGGTAVGDQTVPAIGGMEGRSQMSPEAQTVKVVASAHLTDGPRAEGVAYDTNASVGEKLDTGAYPAGTAFADPTPGESVN